MTASRATRFIVGKRLFPGRVRRLTRGLMQAIGLVCLAAGAEPKLFRPRPVTPPAASSPTLSLQVAPEVRPGEAVPMVLRVANRTSSPLTIYLRGRPIAFDLIVAQADGTVLWRRLEGAVTSMVLQVRTLAPGETIELRDTWYQKTNAGVAVRPGDYVATGELLTDQPRPLATPPAQLRILPALRR